MTAASVLVVPLMSAHQAPQCDRFLILRLHGSVQSATLRTADAGLLWRILWLIRSVGHLRASATVVSPAVDRPTAIGVRRPGTLSTPVENLTVPPIENLTDRRGD